MSTQAFPVSELTDDLLSKASYKSKVSILSKRKQVFNNFRNQVNSF